MSEDDGFQKRDMAYAPRSHPLAKQASFVNHMLGKRSTDQHPWNDDDIGYHGEVHDYGFAAHDGWTMDSHNAGVDAEALIGHNEDGFMGGSGQQSKRSPLLQEDGKESNPHNPFVRYHQLEFEKGNGKKLK